MGTGEKKKNKLFIQHRVFVFVYLSRYKPYRTGLKFVEQTRHGAVLESLYHKDSTTSRPLNKVKPCSAKFEPGWVTKYEYPVL